MRVISLLFHDVYASDPAESGFVSSAANRYKLSLAAFDAQLASVARQRDEAPILFGHRARSSAAAMTSGEASHGDGANRDGRHPPYAITFDDGGVSYYTAIADRLEARGWRGHCFVSTAFVGRRGFLDAVQIRELDARGHVIGSHSATHPARFSALPFDRMVREWRDSRVSLENLLGHAIDVASVPGGYFSSDVARAAREAGLKVLFTSEPVTRVQHDAALTLIGRFTIRHGDSLDAAMRFVGEAPWARSRAWLSWNAKAIVKPVLGPAYGRVADKVCALRRNTPRLASGVIRPHE